MISQTLADALGNFIQIYIVLLFVRVLLSWFPNIDWSRNPWAILSQLTDPYLNLFRSIIPPLGGIDLSPILAFLALQVGGQLLVEGLRSLPV
ncbi:YggT family protein [Gloeobacter kilaueensis]|uniref:YggT family protein n=1 Tax=Gloeobacter kilaueensis (strain ATCC BAA-2537 / CCAP 1431/1 / ULC 316 / JS1) TaxID=1183438 RepID=U5QIC6_GLOK1|nr:YggT family protein [Gloeobacter kilaueensis]AGY57339.1 YggT family protein [Gloeobacter kilaueensis JS1]